MTVDQATGLREQARARLIESADVQRQAAEACTESLVAAAEAIASCFSSTGKVLLCGNGGSAADCQHMATEFVGRLSKQHDRPGLPAIALTTDSSFLTAHANDVGFDAVFERQVQALGRPGDVLIGVSTSGSSTNVLRAMGAASAIGMLTIALTGSAGRIAQLAEILVAVPSSDTQYIQEALLAIEHTICELVEHSLYGDEGDRQ